MEALECMIGVLLSGGEFAIGKPCFRLRFSVVEMIEDGGKHIHKVAAADKEEVRGKKAGL